MPQAPSTENGRPDRQAQPPAPALEISGLTVAYGEKPALLSVDAVFPQGAMSAIVGPNGAGKSSLLKAAMGMTASVAGNARFFGGPLDAMRARVAYVPQRASVDWDFPATVMDVVLMGLYARLGPLRWIGARERDRARDSLRRVGLESFADRQIGQLSGGQQQRVFIARALVQDADLLVLDEPLAGVDAATEKTVIALLRRLVAEGRSIVAVHHDLTTVADYFDHVLLLNVRRIANGPTAEAFNAETLAAAYGGQLSADRTTIGTSAQSPAQSPAKPSALTAGA